MTYDFTRTGPQIQAIHDTVSSPSSNQAFTDAIANEIIPEYTDMVFDSVADMISGKNAAPWSLSTIGTKCGTGGTSWIQRTFSSPMTISDFSPLNDIHAADFIDEGGDLSSVISDILPIIPTSGAFIRCNLSSAEWNSSVLVQKNNVYLDLTGCEISIDNYNYSSGESPLIFDDGFYGGGLIKGVISGTKQPTTQFNGFCQFGTPGGTKGGHPHGSVAKTRISGISGHGVIAFNGSENTFVYGCFITDCDNCVGFMKETTNCKVSNCILQRAYEGDNIDAIYHHVHAVYLRGWNHQVIGNTLRNCGGYGVNCNDDNNEGGGNHIITGNHIYGNRDGAVLMVQGCMATMTGNYCFLNHVRVSDAVPTDTLNKWGVGPGFGDNRIEVKLDWVYQESDWASGVDKGCVAIWGGTHNVNQRAVLANNIIEDNYTQWQIFLGDNSTAGADEVQIIGGSIDGPRAIFTNQAVKQLLRISDVEIRTDRIDIVVESGGKLDFEGEVTINDNGQNINFGIYCEGGDIGKFHPNIYAESLGGSNYPGVVYIAGTLSGEIGGVIKMSDSIGSGGGLNRLESVSGVTVASSGQVDVTAKVIGNNGSGRNDWQNGVTFVTDPSQVSHFHTVTPNYTGVWAGVMSTRPTAPSISNGGIIQNANQPTHNPTGGAEITLNNVVLT